MKKKPKKKRPVWKIHRSPPPKQRHKTFRDKSVYLRRSKYRKGLEEWLK